MEYDELNDAFILKARDDIYEFHGLIGIYEPLCNIKHYEKSILECMSLCTNYGGMKNEG
jgi:hypothetical protein